MNIIWYLWPSLLYIYYAYCGVHGIRCRWCSRMPSPRDPLFICFNTASETHACAHACPKPWPCREMGTSRDYVTIHRPLYRVDRRAWPLNCEWMWMAICKLEGSFLVPTETGWWFLVEAGHVWTLKWCWNVVSHFHKVLLWNPMRFWQRRSSYVPLAVDCNVAVVTRQQKFQQETKWRCFP